MRTLKSELEALVALTGGIQETADALDIDQSLLQSGLRDYDSISRREGADIDSAVATYLDDNPDIEEQLDDAELLFGNLVDNQIDVLLDWISTGQGNFADAMESFEKDTQQQKYFWAWFRENFYPK